MSKIKYYYDTETCKYERVRTSFWDWILNLIGFLVVSFLLSVVLVVLYSYVFPHPKEKSLTKQNAELEKYLTLLESKSKETILYKEALVKKDSLLYKAVTGAKNNPSEYESKAFLTSREYYKRFEAGLPNTVVINQKMAEIKQFKRRVDSLKATYTQMIELVSTDDKASISNIPSIQPIENKELKKLASGFGYRTHPKYKTKNKHYGIDFSCEEGTPVFATADGKVKYIKKKGYDRYGSYIEIDHGNGYITRYAHVKDFEVKKNKTVKKGDKIGVVGDPTILIPHLYYEVEFEGEKVNPVHFFFEDLNYKEYEKLYRLASLENQFLS